MYNIRNFRPFKNTIIAIHIAKTNECKSKNYSSMVDTYLTIDSFLQAMVAKFSSISTRKLPKALSVLSRDKTMVATCDYGDFHKMVKHFVMAGLLGSSAQV